MMKSVSKFLSSHSQSLDTLNEICVSKFEFSFVIGNGPVKYYWSIRFLGNTLTLEEHPPHESSSPSCVVESIFCKYPNPIAS